MPSFDARVRVPGQSRIPLGVEVDVSGERIVLTSGGNRVVDWKLEDVSVTRHADGFHLKADGEEMILSVADSTGFARELRIEERSSNGSGNGAVPDASRAVTNELVADVWEQISDLASALTSDTVAPETVFARWLGLLKRLNQLHGRGKLSSLDFYRLNSRLLELMPEPAIQPETVEA